MVLVVLLTKSRCMYSSCVKKYHYSRIFFSSLLITSCWFSREFQDLVNQAALTSHSFYNDKWAELKWAVRPKQTPDSDIESTSHVLRSKQRNVPRREIAGEAKRVQRDLKKNHFLQHLAPGDDAMKTYVDPTSHATIICNKITH